MRALPTNRYWTPLTGVPVQPFSVIPFTGGPIPRGVWQTDWHVIDARGHTLAVVPGGRHTQDRARRYRTAMRAAAEIAEAWS